MNKKLLSILLLFLCLLTISQETRAETYNVTLPHNYYYYREIEAGHADLIFWEFQCTGNKIKLFLMDSSAFQSFQIWPCRLTIEAFGTDLTGLCSQASGQLRPDNTDTYYFIFFNYYLNSSASLHIEITKVTAFYIIVPTIAIAIVVVVILVGALYVSEKKSEKKERDKKNLSENADYQEMIRTHSSQERPISILGEETRGEEKQGEKKENIIFCPYCGERVLHENADFCVKCGRKISFPQEQAENCIEPDEDHHHKEIEQELKEDMLEIETPTFSKKDKKENILEMLDYQVYCPKCKKIVKITPIHTCSECGYHFWNAED